MGNHPLLRRILRHERVAIQTVLKISLPLYLIIRFIHFTVFNVPKVLPTRQRTEPPDALKVWLDTFSELSNGTEDGLCELKQIDEISPVYLVFPAASSSVTWTFYQLGVVFLARSARKDQSRLLIIMSCFIVPAVSYFTTVLAFIWANFKHTQAIGALPFIWTLVAEYAASQARCLERNIRKYFFRRNNWSKKLNLYRRRGTVRNHRMYQEPLGKERRIWNSRFKQFVLFLKWFALDSIASASFFSAHALLRILVVAYMVIFVDSSGNISAETQFLIAGFIYPAIMTLLKNVGTLLLPAKITWSLIMIFPFVELLVNFGNVMALLLIPEYLAFIASLVVSLAIQICGHVARLWFVLRIKPQLVHSVTPSGVKALVAIQTNNNSLQEQNCSHAANDNEENNQESNTNNATSLNKTSMGVSTRSMRVMSFNSPSERSFYSSSGRSINTPSNRVVSFKSPSSRVTSNSSISDKVACVKGQTNRIASENVSTRNDASLNSVKTIHHNVAAENQSGALESTVHADLQGGVKSAWQATSQKQLRGKHRNRNGRMSISQSARRVHKHFRSKTVKKNIQKLPFTPTERLMLRIFYEDLADRVSCIAVAITLLTVFPNCAPLDIVARAATVFAQEMLSDMTKVAISHHFGVAEVTDESFWQSFYAIIPITMLICVNFVYASVFWTAL